MSASEAALTCCGLTFSTPAATALAAVDLPAALGNGMVVLLGTVWAMARTSSRLKAIGLVAAFRLRILSRNAVFLDGFSMVFEFLADVPLAAGLAGGALTGAALAAAGFAATGFATTGFAGAPLAGAGRGGAGETFFAAGFGAAFLALDLWFFAMGSSGEGRLRL
jgi:hypothetical protein